MKPQRHSRESGTPSFAEHLLTHFDRIADAPASIPRLRRFILDLAVRGKLVPQDPNDEPASELLKRIAVEKERLAIAGNFKTHNSDFPRDDTDFPFSTPANWVWSYLDDISAIARGGSPRPIKSYLTDDPDGIPWIKIGDSVRGNIYIDRTKDRIRSNGLTKSRLVVPGDLLLSNSMSFGYPYITNIEGCIHDGWLVIRTPEKFLDKLYLHTVLLSDHAKVAFSKAASGAVVQNLNADKVRLLSVPLPPLDEQHRIVAKVDELMALCDQLEAARTDRETTRNRLAAASLARLNTPDPDPATFQNHTAFALENLTPLTTRPDQVKPLRQTILNLAIRGKLVAQDPNDDPASNLVKRIADDRESFGTIGSLKKSKPLPPIDTANTPFELPPGWAWVRFPEIGIFGRGKSKHRPRNDPILYRDGKYPFIQTGDVARSKGLVRTYSSLYNEAGLAQSAIWPAGTLCITIAANIADSGILAFDACFPDSVVGLVVHDCFKTAKFFEYFIRTAKGDLQDFAPSTAQKNINLGALTEVLIPLPPLAELHRIVAKVDELMALCDRLEESLAIGSDTRGHLLDTILHDALNG